MHAQFVADAALRERFAQEAKMGGRIESEHVVDVVAAGIDAGTGMRWLVLESRSPRRSLTGRVATRRRPVGTDANDRAAKSRRRGVSERSTLCSVHETSISSSSGARSRRRYRASRMARGNAAVCGGRTEGTRGCQLRELLARLAEHQKDSR